LHTVWEDLIFDAFFCEKRILRVNFTENESSGMQTMRQKFKYIKESPQVSTKSGNNDKIDNGDYIDSLHRIDYLTFSMLLQNYLQQIIRRLRHRMD